MQHKYRNQKNAEIMAAYWGKSLAKPDWYEVKAQADDAAEIMIYDVIGWPFNDASELVRHIAGLKGKAIKVRLNTPGGDVFDGMAIFNALKAHDGKVTVVIESLAASMGSIIALAGAEVQAYSNSMMMIHEPWGYVAGNQYELRDIADVLEKMSANMIDIYASESNVGKRDVKAMMKAETWMTAKEAKEKGFIDTVLESGKAAKAQFDLSVFSNVPDDILSAQPECGRELSAREIEHALRDAGASRNFARAVSVGRRETDEPDTKSACAAATQTLKIFQGVN